MPQQQEWNCKYKTKSYHSAISTHQYTHIYEQCIQDSIITNVGYSQHSSTHHIYWCWNGKKNITNSIISILNSTNIFRCHITTWCLIPKPEPSYQVTISSKLLDLVWYNTNTPFIIVQSGSLHAQSRTKWGLQTLLLFPYSVNISHLKKKWDN